MLHLHRISWIIGTVLLGASAVVMFTRRQSTVRTRARRVQDVERLAEDLKQAWAGHHTP